MRILLLFLDSDAGVAYMKVEKAYLDEINFELVGFVTLDKEKSGTEFLGAPIYFVGDINENMCDVFVLPNFVLANHLINALRQQLENEYHFPANKIYFDEFLIRCTMIKKYAASKDPDIIDTLEYWRTHELTIFNQHLAGEENTYDEVFIDEKYNLPYILFESASGKHLKMYYPREWHNFKKIDGKNYVENILKEQSKNSPHLYLTDTHKIEDGDVIIDAGVCEGNFSLRYFDVASKIYLFEIENIWYEPLMATFTEAGANFELIKKGVGSVSKGNIERIDNVIDLSKNDRYFLKMDIEGAETDALKGADLLLQTGRVKSSICTYHKADDAENIKAILENYGYKTTFSKGYMTYYLNFDFLFTRDFRHGVIYGD